MNLSHAGLPQGTRQRFASVVARAVEGHTEIETPVNATLDFGPIAGCLLAGLQGIIGALAGNLHVAQDGVDPSALRVFTRLPPETDDDSAITRDATLDCVEAAHAIRYEYRRSRHQTRSPQNLSQVPDGRIHGFCERQLNYFALVALRSRTRSCSPTPTAPERWPSSGATSTCAARTEHKETERSEQVRRPPHSLCPACFAGFCGYSASAGEMGVIRE